MSRERFEWIRDLGHDVLGVTETHQHNFSFSNKRFLTADDASPRDKASGVGMFLSHRMADKKLAHGNVGSRVLWARFEGQFNNIFVVVAYIPHRHRLQPPFMEDTYEDLHKALDLANSQDSLILMGDFNGRLARGNSRVGKYCIHPRSDEGGQLLARTMEQYDLEAVSTKFKPTRRSKFGCATYIMDKTGETGQPPAQIDYILVSKRWASCTLSCRVQWEPALHRFGRHYDHGMIKMRFRMRIRNSYSLPGRPDFGALQNESTQIEFERAIKSEAEKRNTQNMSIEETYQSLMECIQTGIEGLPKVPRKRGKVRRRSEKTMQMFEDRKKDYQSTKKGSIEWHAIRNKWRNKITNSCRDDYRAHVVRIIEKIEEAAEKKRLQRGSRGS